MLEILTLIAINMRLTTRTYLIPRSNIRVVSFHRLRAVVCGLWLNDFFARLRSFDYHWSFS